VSQYPIAGNANAVPYVRNYLVDNKTMNRVLGYFLVAITALTFLSFRASKCLIG